tara:strand:- start:130 stop:540 length:411 start_codon:yes stop_codon:yes gene_type:complete
MTNDCIFCKIIKGKIPCTKLYENNKTFSFLDTHPANLGHTLVIPKKHCETIDQMKKQDLEATIATVQKLAKAINKITKGYNILQNNKRIAGQVVPHVHFHIIPRNKKDNINWQRPCLKYSEKQIKEIQDKIKTLLK